MTVLDVLTQMVLSIVVTAWVLKWDHRSLDPERLARAWNPASFWVAVVVFGALCLPFHYARTRRSVAGFGLGVAWMLGVMVAITLAATAVAEVGALVSTQR